MSVQKVINANAHDNGRAIVLNQRGNIVLGAGYSGNPAISISLSGLAPFLETRFDDGDAFLVTPTINNGRFTIGTSATGLNNLTPPTTCNGVNLKAASTNGGIVYIGSGLNVTAGTAALTDGYPLSAGQELFVPVDNPNKIYAIASATGSLLHAFLI